MKRIILLFMLLGTSSLFAKEAKTSAELNILYHKAQRMFHKRDYASALPLLEKYLSSSVGKKYKRERLFWVIDQVGRIHLRVKRNPEAAIKFFEKILKDSRLSEGEEDDIAAWLSAAKDWKKVGKLPKDATSDGELFELGQRFYSKGSSLSQFPADDAGNAYFAISKTFLIHLIRNFEKSPKMAESLLTLGKIHLYLRTDSEYWNDNYYLKEVIRRYPHSKHSVEAYRLLKEDIEFGFTGSSGNNTPPSIKRMLNSYEKMAKAKKK